MKDSSSAKMLAAANSMRQGLAVEELATSAGQIVEYKAALGVSTDQAIAELFGPLDETARSVLIRAVTFVERRR